MKVVRAPRQAALVIHWPQSAAPAAAREVAARLTARGVSATWSIDQASQVEMLASWGVGRHGADTALIVEPATLQSAPEAAASELARRLELLRSSGANVEMAYAGPELIGDSWPRTLRALGLRGVVAAQAGQPAAARALPFGVWHFTPVARAPRVRRWSDWFRARRPLFAAAPAAPAVVTIELGRVAAAGSRSWREMEASLDEAVESHLAGTVGLVTMHELAAQLTQASAPRPQRSILRAA